MKEQLNILIYGFGNEGLEDDALGLLIVQELQAWVSKLGLKHISLEQNFQLSEGDAELISLYDIAIFVDACNEKIPHFRFRAVQPSFDLPIPQGKVAPSYLLALCQQLYCKFPEVYTLRIKGYEWEVREKLSGPADLNLQLTLLFIKELLLIPDRRFDLIEEKYI